MQLKRILRTFLWFSFGLMLVLGCASRYRLDLYMMAEGHRKKVKIEGTEFIRGSQLNDPYADQKVVVGSLSTVVVTTGTRWRQSEDKRVFMFGFDEYLKCLIYVQLPPVPGKDTIGLPGNSFVHVLGRYDLPAEDKIFLADSGAFFVDSVTSKNLFGTIQGRYKNRSASTLHYDGRFKVRIAK